MTLVATPLFATPWQTVGPFYSIGMTWEGGADLAEGRSQAIEISGRVLDGAGAVVTDAIVELWQADSEGRYAHPADRRNASADSGFKGFGRVGTESGGFRFRTVKPGRVPAADGGLQAPHILVGLQARGPLRRLTTRLYFADESANAEDPVLALVPAERRATLLAEPEGQGVYRWELWLQGPQETVFFAF
jgi:protocatechuate 3,4-dioxygenase alpha subunit